MLRICFLNNRLVGILKMLSLCVACYLLMYSDAIACVIIEGQFLNNIYRCVNDMLDTVSTSYAEPVIQGLSGFVAAMCILAIIIYGYRVGFGAVDKLTTESFILVLKLAVIAAFCLNWELINNYRVMLIGFTEAMSSIFLAGFAPGSGCAASAGAEGVNIFSLFDCVIGIILDNKAKTAGAGLGIMGVAALLIWTGSLGMTIVAEVFAMFAAMVTTAAYMMLLYLQASFAITILSVMVPLVLPLMLIKQYEDNVGQFVKLFIFYSLLPVIMSAYVGLMLAVLSYEATLMRDLFDHAQEVIDDPRYPNEISILASDTIGSSSKEAKAQQGEYDEATNTMKGGNVDASQQVQSSKYGQIDQKQSNQLKTDITSENYQGRRFDEGADGNNTVLTTLENEGTDVKDQEYGIGAAIIEFKDDVVGGVSGAIDGIGASLSAAKESAKKKVLQAGAKVLNLQSAFTVSYLPWAVAKTKLMILYLLAFLITFSVMLDFLKQLPKILEKFIAGDFQSSAQNSKIFGQKQTSAIKNASEMKIFKSR